MAEGKAAPRNHCPSFSPALPCTFVPQSRAGPPLWGGYLAAASVIGHTSCLIQARRRGAGGDKNPMLSVQKEAP